MAKEGLTLKKMLKNTPPNVLEKLQFARILKIEETVSKKGRVAVKATVQCTPPHDTKKRKADKHKLFIIGLENEGPVSKQKCMCSCDCDNFKFVWEYALTEHGASKIKHSNGAPPHITNPNLVPGVCHHLAYLFKHAIKKGL